jgi:hypothetical protein
MSMDVSNPIQIVPLHREALAAPVTTANLTYRGGPLLTAVEVFTFFWGSAWQGRQASLVDQVNQFFDFIVTSDLLDQLAEYSVPGLSIGHGSRSGTVILGGDVPSTLDDSDVQNMIQQEISNDVAVPQPAPSSLYFVFLPPGTTLTMNGGASCQNFCGYHRSFHLEGLGDVFYAVMPYPDCAGCAGGIAVLDALTSTSSHELCEAITDPMPGQGWYDDQNGEIGDICAWQTKTLGGYTVQLEWSTQHGQCT